MPKSIHKKDVRTKKREEICTKLLSCPRILKNYNSNKFCENCKENTVRSLKITKLNEFLESGYRSGCVYY